MSLFRKKDDGKVRVKFIRNHSIDGREYGPDYERSITSIPEDFARYLARINHVRILDEPPAQAPKIEYLEGDE